MQAVQAGHAEIDAEKDAGVVGHFFRFRFQVAGIGFEFLDVFLRFLGGFEPPGDHQAFFPFAFILDEFNSQEAEPAQQRDRQQRGAEAFLVLLRGAHRAGHREAAGDEHRGVDRPQRFIEEAVRPLENFRVVRAIDGVSAENAAEKQDFGEQKDPHAELARRELLFMRLKMMRQECRMFAVFVRCGQAGY